MTPTVAATRGERSSINPSDWGCTTSETGRLMQASRNPRVAAWRQEWSFGREPLANDSWLTNRPTTVDSKIVCEPDSTAREFECRLTLSLILSHFSSHQEILLRSKHYPAAEDRSHGTIQPGSESREDRPSL